RTSISAASAGFSTVLSVTEAIHPRRKPSGIEMIPGFARGKIAKSAPGIIAVSDPETTGEKLMSSIAEIRPPQIDQTAPREVKRTQNRQQTTGDRIADP